MTGSWGYTTSLNRCIKCKWLYVSISQSWAVAALYRKLSVLSQREREREEKNEALNGAFVVWVGVRESTRNTDWQIPGPAETQIPPRCTWYNVNKCLLCPPYSPASSQSMRCLHVCRRATVLWTDIWLRSTWPENTDYWSQWTLEIWDIAVKTELKRQNLR